MQVYLLDPDRCHVPDLRDPESGVYRFLVVDGEVHAGAFSSHAVLMLCMLADELPKEQYDELEMQYLEDGTIIAPAFVARIRGGGMCSEIFNVFDWTVRFGFTIPTPASVQEEVLEAFENARDGFDEIRTWEPEPYPDDALDLELAEEVPDAPSWDVDVFDLFIELSRLAVAPRAMEHLFVGTRDYLTVFLALNEGGKTKIYVSLTPHFAAIARILQQQKNPQLPKMLEGIALLPPRTLTQQVASIEGVVAAGTLTERGEIDAWLPLKGGVEIPHTLRDEIVRALAPTLERARERWIERAAQEARIRALELQLSPKLTDRARAVALGPDPKILVQAIVTYARHTIPVDVLTPLRKRWRVDGTFTDTRGCTVHVHAYDLHDLATMHPSIARVDVST